MVEGGRFLGVCTALVLPLVCLFLHVRECPKSDSKSVKSFHNFFGYRRGGHYPCWLSSLVILAGYLALRVVEMPTRPRKPQRQYQHVVAPNGEGSPSPCHASTLARTVVLLILVCACTPTSSSTSPGGTANTPSATSRRPLSPGKGSNTYADSTNTDQHQSHGSSDATNVLSPACPGGAISGKTVTKTGKIDYSFRHIGPAGVPALLDYLSEQNTPQAGAEADAGHFSPKTALIGVAEVEGSIATDSTVEDTARDRQCSPSVSMTATSVSSPLHELGLRECLLGDTGVAEAAQSSWICGPDGVKVLSLRQNQVRERWQRRYHSVCDGA